MLDAGLNGNFSISVYGIDSDLGCSVEDLQNTCLFFNIAKNNLPDADFKELLCLGTAKMYSLGASSPECIPADVPFEDLPHSLFARGNNEGVH